MIAKLLVKGNEFYHTYSNNVKDKLISKGWICIGSVKGWNMSWRY